MWIIIKAEKAIFNLRIWAICQNHLVIDVFWFIKKVFLAKINKINKQKASILSFIVFKKL